MLKLAPIFSLFVIFLTSACSKDENGEQIVQNQLLGSWTLRYYELEESGESTRYDAQNGEKWTFEIGGVLLSYNYRVEITADRETIHVPVNERGSYMLSSDGKHAEVTIADRHFLCQILTLDAMNLTLMVENNGQKQRYYFVRST